MNWRKTNNGEVTYCMSCVFTLCFLSIDVPNRVEIFPWCFKLLWVGLIHDCPTVYVSSSRIQEHDAEYCGNRCCTFYLAESYLVFKKDTCSWHIHPRTTESLYNACKGNIIFKVTIRVFTIILLYGLYKKAEYFVVIDILNKININSSQHTFYIARNLKSRSLQNSSEIKLDFSKSNKIVELTVKCVELALKHLMISEHASIFATLITN